jgi:hypothetical protein
MRNSGILGIAVVGALSFASSGAVAGPVRIDSQQRSVTARVQPGQGAAAVIDTRSATGNGPFDESVAVDASGDGFVGRANATLTSTIGNDGFHYEGTLAWEVQDTRSSAATDQSTKAEASFLTDISFTLDEAYDFSFTESLNSTAPGSGESGESVTVLFFEGGPALPGESGTLQPGSYNLRVQRSTEALLSGTGLATYAIDFDVDFNLAPSDGSSEPNPIPLPPAAWAGLATMGLIGLTRAVRRLPRHA